MDYKVISKYYNSKIVYNHSINNSPQPKSPPPHQHDYIDITYFISGDATSYIADKSYKLKPHQVILVRPFEEHYLKIESSEVYERYNIHIKEKMLPQGIINKIPKSSQCFTRDNEDILEIFKKFDKYCNKFPKQSLKYLLNSLTIELIFNLILKCKDDKRLENQEMNPYIKKALEYINENLTTIKNIDEICKQIYVSKRRFYHLFLQNLNTSPMNYINTQRLILAKSKIENGEKPTRVYLDCGYENYPTFYRAYRSKFSIKPTETPIKKQKTSKNN
jgi:AraC-like DNA-binding protein